MRLDTIKHNIKNYYKSKLRRFLPSLIAHLGNQGTNNQQEGADHRHCTAIAAIWIAAIPFACWPFSFFACLQFLSSITESFIETALWETFYHLFRSHTDFIVERDFITPIIAPSTILFCFILFTVFHAGSTVTFLTLDSKTWRSNTKR